MRETDKLAPTPVSWDTLQIPEKYSTLPEQEQTAFLVSGIDVLAAKMDAMHLRMTGNVLLLKQLVTGSKEAITEDQLDEAGIGFEFAVDVFARRMKPVAIEEIDRQTVAGFLKELDRYLDKKYNPQPTLIDKIRRVLRIK